MVWAGFSTDTDWKVLEKRGWYDSLIAEMVRLDLSSVFFQSDSRFNPAQRKALDGTAQPFPLGRKPLR
ncbi:MAG: hypothetical protein HQL67_05665 [Magnetococcales bacterium]|nr:hypothetical protein [Magnetococcales bacterium]